MWCSRWSQKACRAGLWAALLVEISLAQSAAVQHPLPEPDLGPSRTPKQQREWLEWNHRRVQRDVRRLVELAQEVREQAESLPRERLAKPQQESIRALGEKITVLSQEFEKTKPDILPLGIVGRAEAIEAEAKTLRKSFATASRGERGIFRLNSLTQQIEERARRVAERLRYP